MRRQRQVLMGWNRRKCWVGLRGIRADQYLRRPLRLAIRSSSSFSRLRRVPTSSLGSLFGSEVEGFLGDFFTTLVGGFRRSQLHITSSHNTREMLDPSNQRLGAPSPTPYNIDSYG
ncbi:hypothetical protein SAMN05216299_1383 [Nitrosospira sp. Nsp14]|nr:hypothetical protein SAMN05216299_1383 [Nitrosospira sp. Nsp14]